MRRLWNVTRQRWRCGRDCPRASLPRGLRWRDWGGAGSGEAISARLGDEAGLCGGVDQFGFLLRDAGREAEAEAALRRAVELRPDLISGWVNLALLERDCRRPEAAEACLRRALALNPNQVETLVAWCQFRAAERDVAGAREWMRWALARNAEFDEAVNMHGIVLHLEGRFEEAIPVFERAEALGSRAAASNRGNSLLDLGRMEEALKAHERAVELDAASAGAKYNLALTQLRLGEWKRGWAGYEARWKFREVHAGRATLRNRDGMARNSTERACCCMPNRDWETRSSSAVMRRWWLRAAACRSSKCNRRLIG